MILQLDGEPLGEELSFLLIHVDVVFPILCEVAELAHVLIDSMVPLLQVSASLQRMRPADK
jgi:hypothetical protein